MENIIIIGSGPAAYAAALSSVKHKPLMFEGELVGDIGPGGQLTTTTNVDNYPGFPNGVQGPDLMEAMREQAINKGIRIVSKTVTSLKKEKDNFVVSIKGKDYAARSVIIATGASAKRLHVPGTNDGEFWQKGISACAICDGFFFKGKNVAVLGGGDSAMEEAIYLSNIAKKLYVIHRRNEFRARPDKVDKIKSISNLEIVTPAVLVSAHGEGVLKCLKLQNPETKETFELEVDGLFFGIGHDPNVKFLGNLLELNELGYIETDSDTHTSAEGCFACGDVQDYVFRQAITAAASGCIAGFEAVSYVESKNKSAN